MASQQSTEGSSSSDVPGESSESTLQLNIKTLDSRICNFHVNKNIVVSAFKEKIASQIGVPVEQQRLIFRGKVLKDNLKLSEYNVENGDTLHLVERQPQPAPPSNTGEATSSNNNRGQDPTAGGPRNRIGQIAHSVVLGTLNVGDPGEGGVPDLSRVIGAVLNSIGIGNLAGGVQPGVQTSLGSETGGSSVDAGSQSQGGNPSVPWQALHGQSIPFPMPIPMGAAIPVPSMNMPIPDSLNTLTEFMHRMELAFAQNGTRQDQSPTASPSPPTPELPTNTRGFPTAETLTAVLQHAQRLLCDHAVPALSHTAGRLDQDGGSNDLAVRGQVQAESTQLGVAMQHLGALLLELGRTILTFRMGLSPGDSFVNAGPAVYISPSGPNPIMVQPFPLQTSSFFGSSPGVTPSPVAMNPVGVGNIPRNVNIHIHTGAALSPIVSRARNGEERQGEPVNGTDSGQPRVSSGINVNATGVPPGTGTGVSQASDSNSISPIVAEINAQLRSLVANRQNENRAPSEGSASQEQPVGCARDEDMTSHQGSSSSQVSPNVAIKDSQQAQTEDLTSSERGPHNRSSLTEHAESLEGQSISRQGNDNPDRSSGTPLGLGLGGLQPKRRARQPKAEAKNSDVASSSDQNETSRAVGLHVLQSLASLSTGGNGNPSLVQPSDLARGPVGSVPASRQNTDDHIDVTDAMSQVLRSPSLDGLLAGVSQQNGVGSPDMLTNMLQQFTQNPAMRNTVNQIAQQIDSHDLGSMFSGLDSRGQGGGIDLSRMMQQMMPIVSQALGGVSSTSRASEPTVLSQSASRRDMAPQNDDPQQIDLRPLVQRLEVESSSEEVFRSLVDRAVRLSSNGNAEESVVNELCSREDLTQEFMEMLRLDVTRRLHDEMGS